MTRNRRHIAINIIRFIGHWSILAQHISCEFIYWTFCAPSYNLSHEYIYCVYAASPIQLCVNLCAGGIVVAEPQPIYLPSASLINIECHIFTSKTKSIVACCCCCWCIHSLTRVFSKRSFNLSDYIVNDYLAHTRKRRLMQKLNIILCLKMFLFIKFFQ